MRPVLSKIQKPAAPTHDPFSEQQPKRPWVEKNARVEDSESDGEEAALEAVADCEGGDADGGAAASPVVMPVQSAATRAH